MQLLGEKANPQVFLEGMHREGEAAILGAQPYLGSLRILLGRGECGRFTRKFRNRGGGAGGGGGGGGKPEGSGALEINRGVSRKEGW